jgi:hypothetical protein
MTSARLVVAALLVCTASAFAQVQTLPGSYTGDGPTRASAYLFAPIPLILPPLDTRVPDFLELWWAVPEEQPAQTQGIFGPLHPVVIKPWEVPYQPQQTDPAQLSGDDMNILQAKVNLLQAVLDANLDKGVFITPDGAGWGDGICYTMRSYVVARDNRDSDAVHPVSYSTCQMGSKYHLKTAEGHAATRIDPSAQKP